MAAHLLVGDDDLSATPTEEKAIRGTQDDVADALLLIEAYEREALHGEIEILVDQAGWSEIPIVRTAEYRLAQLLAAPGTSASG